MDYNNNEEGTTPMDNHFILGETCTQCGGMALLRFEPEDKMLWFSCAICGYEREYMESFDAALSSCEAVIAPRMNGLYYRQVPSPRQKPGFGAWRLTLMDGSVKSGQANCPITPEAFQRWQDRMLDPELNLEESYLTSWHADSGKLEILYGSADLIERLRKTGK